MVLERLPRSATRPRTMVTKDKPAAVKIRIKQEIKEEVDVEPQLVIGKYL